jgi:hypothetical protein
MYDPIGTDSLDIAMRTALESRKAAEPAGDFTQGDLIAISAVLLTCMLLASFFVVLIWLM